MRKIYFLKTCDTCRRILRSVNTSGFELHEIKSAPLTAKQLEELYQMAGSYEALFNKRAKKYRAMDLKNQSLTEKDYRQLLLEEYTFLKRPVFVVDGQIFIGNAKKTVAQIRERIG